MADGRGPFVDETAPPRIAPVRVLLVDDQPLVCTRLREMLVRCGVREIDIVHTHAEAAGLIAGDGYGVAFIDLKLGERLDGVDLARRAVMRGIRVIAVTGHADLPPALTGVALLTKPFSIEAVRLVFETVMRA